MGPFDTSVSVSAVSISMEAVAVSPDAVLTELQVQSTLLAQIYWFLVIIIGLMVAVIVWRFFDQMLLKHL